MVCCFSSKVGPGGLRGRVIYDMHGRALREHHRRVFKACFRSSLVMYPTPFTIASGRCIIIYECWRQLWQAAAKKDASVSNYFLIQFSSTVTLCCCCCCCLGNVLEEHSFEQIFQPFLKFEGMDGLSFMVHGGTLRTLLLKAKKNWWIIAIYESLFQSISTEVYL